MFQGKRGKRGREREPLIKGARKLVTRERIEKSFSLNPRFVLAEKFEACSGRTITPVAFPLTVPTVTRVVKVQFADKSISERKKGGRR